VVGPEALRIGGTGERCTAARMGRIDARAKITKDK
jgi:hypothetical protein